MRSAEDENRAGRSFEADGGAAFRSGDAVRSPHPWASSNVRRIRVLPRPRKWTRKRSSSGFKDAAFCATVSLRPDRYPPRASSHTVEWFLSSLRRIRRHYICKTDLSDNDQSLITGVRLPPPNRTDNSRVSLLHRRPLYPEKNEGRVWWGIAIGLHE